jgi:hypothetical protein
MKFSITALALTAGLFWGGAMFIVALANFAAPGYGAAFLELAASIYPGYQAGSGAASIIVGTVYGLVDGAIAGAIFGWLYNLIGDQLSHT